MTDESSEGIELDALLDILSNERRRYCLMTIKTSEEPLSLKAIAREMAGGEGSRCSERIRVSLYQCHVPRMEDAGVVRETGSGIELGEHGEEAIEALRRLGAMDEYESRIPFLDFLTGFSISSPART